MNNSVVPVWKPQGLTPLKALQEFKKNNHEFAKKKISYAGRLDPMAEGVLLLLIDEENKKRHEYEDLEKTYEAEVVLRISTDSFDALGIIEAVNFKTLSKKEVDEHLKTFIGKQNQIYPPYSSKVVNGKSLYWWARNNKLKEIKIPTKEIEIHKIKLADFGEIDSMELVREIIKKIKIVEGDFRQKEIIKSWEKFEKENKNKKFMKIKIKVSCSSGTYVRRIASDLGEKLGTGAFALSIKRVGVGRYRKKDCVSSL